MHSPKIISLSSLSLATDVTDVTLGESILWLGRRTGGGGTAKLDFIAFLAAVHGLMDNRHTRNKAIFITTGSCKKKKHLEKIWWSLF